jgi:intracellular sulfur oxidation DsrE/DsrF family protein
MRSSEFCDFSCRPSNSTANIQNLVSILDTDFGSEIVLVAGNGLVEGFTERESAEMERLSPSVLVYICPQVVVSTLISKKKLVDIERCERTVW